MGSVEISNLENLVLLSKNDIEESPNIMVTSEGDNALERGKCNYEYIFYRPNDIRLSKCIQKIGRIKFS
jgi:hypothetical protein